MRRRIETLLGHPGGALWIGTFHGLAHRLLRLHWREAGLPQGFQILDSEDQARLLRKVLKALDLDETRWVPREILWFINAQKDEGHRPKHLKDDGDPTRRQLIKIYQAYEEACQRGGRRGLRRAAAARLSSCGATTRAAAALPHALPPRAGGRVPGHQRHPVPLADAARGSRRVCRSRSATTISRSTAGAARAWRTCTSSAATTRRRRSTSWSRTTAPPARS